MQLDVICWFLLALFNGVFAVINYSTTIRTALKETTQKGDALSDKRTVEQGSLVLLFENVFADNTEKEVNLYVNGVENHTLVVIFKIVNGRFGLDWKTDKYSKIFMDHKGNIWIANMDETYERKFHIYSSEIQREVELTILKNSYSTTERTALQETKQKDNALPDDLVYWKASTFLLVTVIIVMVIFIVIIWKKDRICAWIQCKKSNGVPQPVQVTSHRDSPDSTSYQLMWNKPDDGGSRLINYIIRYCEVEIFPDRTEYELTKYLKPFESVDNILPSAVSYELSPLTPGRYYLVEIQAIYTQGQTLKSFIFKTKEGIPHPVQVTSHRDSPDSTSYKLMWDKPDDGGSPLIKYIILYCQVEINPNGTEYELSKPLNPLDISPSDVSYTLSSLKPGSYYQVEVQAVNTIGMSSKRFIFKTKESAPKQAVEEVSDELEKNDTAIKQTFSKLAVTSYGRGTGIEDNQGQLDLSSTRNSSSSVTFSAPGHSGIQPFNNDEQDANPKQDNAQDVRVVIDDSDSEDKCQEPLLTDHAKM